MNAQAVDILTEKLASSRYEPGTMIPSAVDLAQELGIESEALEDAISALVYDGRLSREYSHRPEGVTLSRMDRMGVMGGILSLTKEAIKRGMTPGSRVVQFAIAPAGSLMARHLQIDPADKIVTVERLRTVNGEPIALEMSHIPLKFIPDVTPEMFEGTGEAASSFDLLDKKGIHLTRAVDIVSAVVVQEREAALLRMKEGEPILQRDRTTWDDRNRLAKWSRALFRAKSQYEMKLR